MELCGKMNGKTINVIEKKKKFPIVLLTSKTQNSNRILMSKYSLTVKFTPQIFYSRNRNRQFFIDKSFTSHVTTYVLTFRRGHNISISLFKCERDGVGSVISFTNCGDNSNFSSSTKIVCHCGKKTTFYEHFIDKTFIRSLIKLYYCLLSITYLFLII